MKEQIEEALQNFIESYVTYQGEPTVDIIFRGGGERPVGNSILIIDVNGNIDKLVMKLDEDGADVTSSGEMFWIFKLQDSNGVDISEESEERALIREHLKGMKKDTKKARVLIKTKSGKNWKKSKKRIVGADLVLDDITTFLSDKE